MEGGNLSNFLSLDKMVDDAGSIIPTVCDEIVAHLEILSELFDKYFATEDFRRMDYESIVLQFGENAR